MGRSTVNALRDSRETGLRGAVRCRCVSAHVRFRQTLAEDVTDHISSLEQLELLREQ